MQEISLVPNFMRITFVFIELKSNLLGRQDLQAPDIKCGAYNLYQFQNPGPQDAAGRGGRNSLTPEHL
jgi:hypothetical protein